MMVEHLCDSAMCRMHAADLAERCTTPACASCDFCMAYYHTDRCSRLFSQMLHTDAQAQMTQWIAQLGVIHGHNPGDASWRHYLHSIYGPHLELPFDLRTLRWFWWSAPGAANLPMVEFSIHRESLPPRTAWIPGNKIERHLSLAGFFITHSGGRMDLLPPSKDEEWIEVMRVSQPPIADLGPSQDATKWVKVAEECFEDQMWYWRAPGSGIWLHTGRTLAVSGRGDLAIALRGLVKELNLPLKPPRFCDVHECGFPMLIGTVPFCDILRLGGYDTVQLHAAFFGRRQEVVDCRTPNRATLPTRQVYNLACPASYPAVPLRRRLPSDNQSCVCDRTVSALQCGMPAQRHRPTAVLAQELGWEKVEDRPTSHIDDAAKFDAWAVGPPPERLRSLGCVQNASAGDERRFEALTSYARRVYPTSRGGPQLAAYVSEYAEWFYPSAPETRTRDTVSYQSHRCADGYFQTLRRLPDEHRFRELAADCHPGSTAQRCVSRLFDLHGVRLARAHSARFVEVSHLAFNAKGPAADSRQTSGIEWADFLDTGRSGWWFIHAPGSGIWYDVGPNCCSATFKNTMMLELLERAMERKLPLPCESAAWLNVCDNQGNASRFVEALRRTRNEPCTSWLHCEEAYPFLRGRRILSDAYDAFMLDLGRALGCDSLWLTSSPLNMGGNFVGELVDLRLPFNFISRARSGRGDASVAYQWAGYYMHMQRLTLRDPLALLDSERAQPCVLPRSPTLRLACQDHISWDARDEREVQALCEPRLPGIPAPRGYTAYTQSNCYEGHGGTDIDGLPVHVKTVNECAARCDEDPRCDCITYCTDGSGGACAQGDCWKRATCDPSHFGADGASVSFSVYVKGSTTTTYG